MGDGGVGWDESIIRGQPLFSLFVFSVARSFRAVRVGPGRGGDITEEGENMI